MHTTALPHYLRLQHLETYGIAFPAQQQILHFEHAPPLKRCS